MGKRQNEAKCLSKKEVIDTSDYTITPTDELYHYGVVGMRWGVRRSTKQLFKRDQPKERRDKALASLNKHREKGTAEVAELKKRGVKLTAAAEKQTIKSETKAAKLRAKAATKRSKMYGLLTSQSKAEKLEFQAKKLDIKAAKLETKATRAKALLKKNETMVAAFEREISNIDTALVNYGKFYLER